MSHPGQSLFLVLLTLPLAGAFARTVTEEEASVAATRWLRANPAPVGARVFAGSGGKARAALDGDGKPLFHVVTFDEGGTLVLSSDTSITPVVAILEADDLEEVSGNPLYEILVADMTVRMAQLREEEGAMLRKAGAGGGRPPAEKEAEAAWEALLGDEGRKRSVPSVRDVRVEPLLSTKWGQTTDAEDRECANYWTPYNYPCGCVALAGAQVARFWSYPDSACPRISRSCRVNGYRRTLTSKGGIYDWASMPDKFGVLSETQREAIGRLCYDFGVAARMDYTSDGSGSWGCLLGDAFLEILGYASAKVYGISGNVFSDDIIERAILANLDAGCPVVLGIDGHEINADGYGFVSGVLYTHLNLGWEGVCDAWYSLPVIDAMARDFYSTVLDETAYNLFPEWSGELLTGRILDAAGNPLEGAVATAVCGSETVSAPSGPHGVYALPVEGGRTWTVVASAGDAASEALEVFVPRSVSTTVSGESILRDTGTVGNSWGNDLTVPVAPSDDLLAAALDTDLDLITDDEAPWFSQTAESVEGASAARSGEPASDGESRLFATVSGPGEIAFWWKCSDGGGSGVLSFHVDGEQRGSISGETDWRSAVFAVEGEGDHVLEWRYAEDVGDGTMSGCGYLDGVAWTSGASRLEELRTAVDNHELSFSTGGDSEWHRTAEEGLVGGDSACSGPIGARESNWMEASGALGEGVVSFRWKASGPKGSLVRFFVDGECAIFRQATDAEWRHEAFRVGPGPHVFRWVCATTSSPYAGSGRFWVDQVVWAPGTPLSPVYRFYSPSYRGHFFTLDETERADLIENNPNWRYEGVAFFALPERTDGSAPLHRFYSKRYLGHFFTCDSAEYKTVRETNPNWRYEGVAWDVRSEPDAGTTPVYRFWSKNYRHHFYTIDKAERDNLIETNPNWAYEGVAFHVWAAPKDHDPLSSE